MRAFQVVGAMAALAASAAHGQDTIVRALVTVSPGFAVIWTAPGPFKQIVAAKDLPFDLTTSTDQSVIITGRSPGQANLLFLDDRNREIAEVVVSVALSAPNIVRMHTKPNTHEYYAYECTPVCRRTEDPKEGPVPQPPQVTETREIRERVIIQERAPGR